MNEFMNYFMVVVGFVWAIIELRGLRLEESKSARALRFQRLALAIIVLMLSLMGFVWRAQEQLPN